jgi:hypothetical protein
MVVAAVALLAFAAVRLLARGWLARTLAIVVLAQAVLAGWSHRELDRIRHQWPAVREQRVTRAAARWEQDLKRGRALVERLATAATSAADRTQQQALDDLDRLTSREALEVGVAILESDGTPFAWAGRHRQMPEAEGDSVDFRANAYYAIIESRRQAGNGRTAVASALLAADPAVPDQARSLAQRF